MTLSWYTAMVEVTVKTVNADNTANNKMAGSCNQNSDWQVQSMVYINWHHAVYFAVCR